MWLNSEGEVALGIAKPMVVNERAVHRTSGAPRGKSACGGKSQGAAEVVILGYKSLEE